MSLHALANHMASRGRGPDTTLVHMAPQEVAGLQALALAHGGSLTINPDTGLPEAGFLKKLLPAIAGFALNAFAPGFGSAIGAALGGLGSAAGTAIGLGGITGLATGNLQKGLMAGLGAYGGASLAGGVMGAGVGAAQQGAMGALTQEQIAAKMAETGLTEQGVLNQAAAEASKSALASGSAGQTLSSGFGAITKDPSAFGNFAKQNAGALLGVTSPLLADQGVETVTKLDNPGYIRNFDYDPMTQTARALNPVRVRDLGYAGGGEIGAPKTITQMPGTSPYRDSQAAYEYLMGIAPKEPQQNTQTQTQTSINPAAEGRYSWDSDKKAYTFIPANGGTETTPAPASNYNPYDFGGGDSGSGAGGGAGGAGTAGAGVSASDPSDFGDTSSSSSDSDSSSDSGEGGGGDGSAGDGAGGAGAGTGLARGGLLHLYKKFAEGGPTNIRDGSSQAAYNYLMGLTNSTRPDAPAYTPQPVYTPPTPAKKDDDLPTLNPFTPVTGGGGGGGIGGGGGGGGGASVGNAPSAGTDPSPTYSGFVPQPANPNIPVVDLTPTPTPTTTPAFQGDPDFYEPYVPPQGDPYDQPYVPPQGDPYDQPYVPYQGDPYDQPYVPYQGDPYDQPYVPPQGDPYDTAPYVPYQGDPYDTAPESTGYEVQPWENVDNPGTGSMAGDVSVNSGNNTYVGPTDDAGGEGMPDAFGSYPGEPTYVGSDGGGGDWWSDDGNSLDDDYDYAGNANGGLMGYANGGMMPRYALGGLGSLGGYSDGGRLLRGPGDGVSDSIPAMIGKRQPARLADGEFVVPARIVSELGNGSTEAGARKLYKMMDRIQAARGKTVGKGRVAKNSRAEKHLPA